MMRPEDYIRQVEDFAAASDAVPGAEFLSFYERHRAKIGELLIELKKDNRSTDEFTLRAGMMPPVSAVIETYACGPCRVCPNGCGDGPECRQPTRRLFTLESCGFWVNQLCREAAKSPVLGHPLREVRWIKDWGLPTQDTQSVRFVTGILLDKLPTPDIIGVDCGS